MNIHLTASDLDTLDTNVGGGLFTYLDNDNELNIEFVRAWTGNNNVSYATHPVRDGNTFRFLVECDEGKPTRQGHPATRIAIKRRPFF